MRATQLLANGVSRHGVDCSCRYCDTPTPPALNLDEGPRCRECDEQLEPGYDGAVCATCERAHFNDTDGGHSRARGKAVRL